MSDFVKKIKSKIYGVNHEWEEWGLPLKEVNHLNSLPRYELGKTTFRGCEVRFADSTTFLKGVKEIFGKEIYFFGQQDAPLIVDCGANVGHSVLYFKDQYPNARVEAYEPDPSIFDILKFNVNAFNLSDVALHDAAVWTRDGSVDFQIEGGFSGRIPMPDDDENLIQVEAVSLESILAERNVDLLKLDVEGAENDLIPACANVLHQVEHVFIEYHSHTDTPQQLHKLLEILSENGFRYHVHEAFARARPYVDTDTMLGMDLQLNIFGIQNG
jgi:FkbM family methyltransferase